MCLYEYVLRVTEWTQNAAVRAGVQTFAWEDGHPRQDSHCQVVTGTELIPCLVGPGIPPRGRPDGMHERIALVLFKSHVSVEELLPPCNEAGEYDWVDAYNRLCQGAGVRARQWLTNMDQMAQHGASDDPLGEQEHCSDEVKETTVDGCTECPDEQAADQAANERALDTENAVSLMNTPFSKQEVVESLDATSALPPVLPVAQQAGSTVWDSAKHRRVREVCSGLQKLCAEARNRSFGLDDAVPEVDPQREQGAAGRSPGVELVELPRLEEVVASVSRQFTLNEEQHLALRVLSNAFDDTTPRIMCHVPGPAGTGKTEIVKALLEVAKSMQKNVATTSPTGVSAELIGGSTVHQLFKIWKKGEKTADERSRMVRLFDRVSLFVCDEVSMVGGSLLSKIDANLRWLFDPDQWLGGKHFAFMGDFLQLPCVKDTPLYSPVSTHGREQNRGLLCWRELTHCVELTEQMRQKDQELYCDTMQAMRAECLQEWHKLYLASRALLPGEQLPPEFAGCTRIVATNETRQALNRATVRRLAEAGADISVCIAVDSGRDGAQLSESQKRTLLQHEGSSVNFLAPFLFLMKGLEVILKKNLAVELGVCNGSSARIVDWVESPEEPDAHEVVDGIRILKFLPVAVYLQFDRDFQLPGLAPGVVCVKPYQEEIRSEDGKILARRRSLAMQLRENTTGHGVQGRTLVLIAVVDKTTGNDDHFSNVAFSRVKHLEALKIIRFSPHAPRKSSSKGLE